MKIVHVERRTQSIPVRGLYITRKLRAELPRSFLKSLMCSPSWPFEIKCNMYNMWLRTPDVLGFNQVSPSDHYGK